MDSIRARDVVLTPSAREQAASPEFSQSTAATCVALIVILAASVLLRLIHLDADPPALMSRDFITDEGWWAHNARNAFFYGHWLIDDHNPGVYSAYLYNAFVLG